MAESLGQSLQRVQLADGERRRSGEAGIDEQDPFPPRDVQCMFDVQLKILQDFDARKIERGDLFGAQWAEGVVAARRVAPAEDEDRC